MGSLGRWNALMSYVKKESVKQTKVNTSEDIEAFIKKNGNSLCIGKDSEDLKKGDKLIYVEINNWDLEYMEDIILSDIGLTDIDAKDFIDEGMFDSVEAFEYDEDETAVDQWTFFIENPKVTSKLKKLDLKKIEANIADWSIDSPNFLEDEVHLGDCSDDIYCGNDNSSTDDFKVTQKFIDGLSVGDVIRLYGNGDGEHC